MSHSLQLLSLRQNLGYIIILNNHTKAKSRHCNNSYIFCNMTQFISSFAIPN